jgi:hypothetical protein
MILLLAACAPTLMQTARTTGQGGFEAGVEGGLVRVSARDTEGEGSGTTVPVVNFVGRYGVSDRVDLGARVGFVGYGLQAKFLLTEPDALSGPRIAIVPEVAAIGGGGGQNGPRSFVARTNLGVLVGVPFEDDNEVTFGILSSNTLFGAGGGVGGAAGQIGLSVGVALQTTDTVQLMPEIGYKPLTYAVGQAEGDTAAGTTTGLRQLSFQLGVLVHNPR